VADHLAQVTGRPPRPLFPDDGTLAGQLGRLVAFHTVPSRVAAPADLAAPAAPAGPGDPSDPQAAFTPELHSVITLLHEHPSLLSRLGLLIDLTIPNGELPQIGLNATAGARLRVTVTSAGGAASAGTLQPSTTHYCPWTAFIRDGEEVFTPFPSTPGSAETTAGLVNLALPGQYSLTQVDTDGSWLKALAMPTPTPTGTGTTSLPALRTTGPALSRADPDQVMQARLTQAASNEDAAFGPEPTPVTLFAEDLTRGYRIDIRDHADGVWRSLHQRDAAYSVPGLPEVIIREEGVVQPSGVLTPPAPSSPAAPAPLPTLNVHETLARWEGWSLSAPHPGLAVDDYGNAVPLPSVPPADGIPLTSSFAVVPGSLPRLRFGHSYDVRARAVDLGGGGLDLAGGDAALSMLANITVSGQPLPVQPAATAPPFTFQRFEPVPAPALVPRERATEGESAERLVIRSSRTQNAAQLAASLNAAAAATTPGTGVRYQGFCERHVAPPKASQQMAERAGLLDGLAAQAAYYVCLKDKGGLADSAVTNIGTGQSALLPDVPDPFTGGTRPAVELVASGNSAYAVHHEADLLLPYLPDWLSAGAVLCDLPGIPAGQQAGVAGDGSLVIADSDLDLSPDSDLCPVQTVTTIPFGNSWPVHSSLRLQLAEGSGPPAWDPAQRVLTVQLAPAQTATIRLSSALTDGALDVLGQWQWLVQEAVTAPAPPPTQPPGTATAPPPTPARPQTADAIIIDYARHGLTWPLTPFREITLVHAAQQPLLDPTITALAFPRLPAATGTPLFGLISLDAASTAKVDLIASWTDPPVVGQPTVTTTAHVLAAALPADASIGRVQNGSGGAPDMLQLTGPAAHHEFGDTKHRQVTYHAVAATRFAEYFPPGTDPATTVAAGPSLTLSVPSSAAPPAPVVREAVPMWRWDRPADPALPRRRYGAGVRLLLEPPWFASGEGEQLAVVLVDPASYPPADGLRARVTHWGADAIFDAPPLPGAPVAASFPAAGPAVSASLDGTQPVVLLPHDVTWDNDRGVYVCDIPVDPGPAYAPFVRLAVVRYQPSSLPGLALSAVVQAPFVQVLPERQVTLTPPAAGGADTYGLQVAGVSYTATGTGYPEGYELDPSSFDPHGILPQPPLISVDVQERLPGTSDAAGWASSAAATVTVAGAVTGQGLRGSPAGTPLWTGQVTLPADRTPGQFRVLVRECELLDSDRIQPYTFQTQPQVEVRRPGTDPAGDPDAAPTIPKLPPHPKPITVHDSYRPGTGRLVFAEEIII
jgi:hypothetical protein